MLCGEPGKSSERCWRSSPRFIFGRACPARFYSGRPSTSHVRSEPTSATSKMSRSPTAVCIEPIYCHRGARCIHRVAAAAGKTATGLDNHPDCRPPLGRAGWPRSTFTSYDTESGYEPFGNSRQGFDLLRTHVTRTRLRGNRSHNPIQSVPAPAGLTVSMSVMQIGIVRMLMSNRLMPMPV